MYSLCGFEDSKNSMLDSPASVHSPASICSPFTLRSPNARKLGKESLIEEGDEEGHEHSGSLKSEAPIRPSRLEDHHQDSPHRRDSRPRSSSRRNLQASKPELQGWRSSAQILFHLNHFCCRLRTCAVLVLVILHRYTPGLVYS